MADYNALDFDKPLEEIRTRIEELRGTADKCNLNLDHEIAAMEQQHESMSRQVYANLSAWQEVQVARHPSRPQTRDYLRLTFSDFIELHGDRSFRDDASIVTGFATIGRHRVMLVGEHKGRTVQERHLCFAGCPHPEGYRKALLKMQMAEKFGMPIITLVDTKGAYPGTGGEERGNGPAIAFNLREMSRLRVPIIVCVIGEGGSGGALGIGVGDRVIMMQHAYYSVISPEGCAAILWRDAAKAPEAAAALKCTSRDLLRLGLVDEAVVEPIGGAHKDPVRTGRFLRESLLRHLDALVDIPADKLLQERYERLRKIGEFEEANEARLAEVLGPPPAPEPEPVAEQPAAESDEPAEEQGAEQDAADSDSVEENDSAGEQKSAG